MKSKDASDNVKWTVNVKFSCESKWELCGRNIVQFWRFSPRRPCRMARICSQRDPHWSRISVNFRWISRGVTTAIWLLSKVSKIIRLWISLFFLVGSFKRSDEIWNFHVFRGLRVCVERCRSAQNVTAGGIFSWEFFFYFFWWINLRF